MRREWLRRRAGVLAVRDFRRFYAGYATSLLGSSMSTVAIAWAVLDSGASATGLGYVFAAAVVPQVLLMAIAGAVADRFGRRRVMLTADALRCAAQASLAVAVFAGRPALWVFVLLAWLVGTGEAFFTPAMDALTVEVAPRDQLGNANALYGLATSAARIAGPVLGGLLIALTGPGGGRGRGFLRGERARPQPDPRARPGRRRSQEARSQEARGRGPRSRRPR